jgi:hypothetical protein
VGLIGAGSIAAARTTGQQQRVFSTESLVPGQTVAGHFVVPPRNQAFAPLLRVRDLSDRCVVNTACTSSSLPLSGVLHVVVTAPDGSTLHTTVAALVKAERLPGGNIAPGTPARRYDATLTLPADLANSYQARTVSFDLQYGSATQVLGESFGRGGVFSGSDAAGGLPFAVARFLIELAAVLSLLAVGLMVLLAARRRRHAEEN